MNGILGTSSRLVRRRLTVTVRPYVVLPSLRLINSATMRLALWQVDGVTKAVELPRRAFRVRSVARGLINLMEPQRNGG